MRFYECLIAALVIFASGCIPPEQPAAADPDPFCHPSCQPGFCPPDQCPPGCCPPQRGSIDVETHGVEVGVSAPPYPVNALAQNETKSMGVSTEGVITEATDTAEEAKHGQCFPCAQPAQRVIRPATGYPAATQFRQPTVHYQNANPQRPHPQPAKASPANEVKQGRFLCAKCQRPTVGKEWQEIWSDDGVSILCMCKECYRTSTPLQREVVMRNYLSRHGVDTTKRPIVEAAVMQASRGD